MRNKQQLGERIKFPGAGLNDELPLVSRMFNLVWRINHLSQEKYQEV